MSAEARSDPARVTPSDDHWLSAWQNKPAALRFWLIIGELNAAEVRKFPAAADKAYRHRELLDTIVTRLFSAGLTLQSAASQLSGPAADAIDDATSQLDDIIREIRDAMLSTEP
jgi:hypothetical protein